MIPRRGWTSNGHRTYCKSGFLIISAQSKIPPRNRSRLLMMQWSTLTEMWGHRVLYLRMPELKGDRHPWNIRCLSSHPDVHDDKGFHHESTHTIRSFVSIIYHHAVHHYLSARMEPVGLDWWFTSQWWRVGGTRACIIKHTSPSLRVDAYNTWL